jgi:hypothetical protein
MFLLVLISLVLSPSHLCVNTLEEKYIYIKVKVLKLDFFFNHQFVSYKWGMLFHKPINMIVVSMNKNIYFIVYFYHVTKIFLDTFSMWWNIL